MDDELDLTVAGPDTPEVDVAPIDDTDDADLALDGPGYAPAVVVDEAMVRRLLKIAGDTAHAMSGEVGHAEPEFLRFTDGELDALAPPMTAYINARPRLQAAVSRGDGVAVVLTLAGYSARNAAAYRRWRDEHDEQEATRGHEHPEDARTGGGTDAGGDGLAGKLSALAAARAAGVRGTADPSAGRDVPGAAG